MNPRLAGAIDCDVHPSVPALSALLPYLDDYWRDMIEVRGIEGFENRAYPPRVPASARPDWKGDQIRAAESVDKVRAQLLDRWQLEGAILNCVYGVQQINDEGLEAAMCTAVNDWLGKEWLDADPRLAASIVIPMQNPARAAEEIERRLDDRRFVQILMPGMHDLPYGRTYWWPIYELAARHGLPVGLHLGSAYRRPITASGWPSFHVEDYVDQTQGLQAQLASLVTRGVFAKFPALKVVLIESGVSWLPAFCWRLSKFWRGVRIEVPWVNRAPVEIIRDHVRLTLTPFDAPPAADAVARLCEHLGSDEMLLFSSDYPHWHFEGDDVLPAGLPDATVDRLLARNPKDTYSRIGGNA